MLHSAMIQRYVIGFSLLRVSPLPCRQYADSTDYVTEQNRDQMKLFVDIARYTSKNMNRQDGSEGSQSKKRKLEDDTPPVKHESGPSSSTLKGEFTNVYTAPDTSFAVPQRKKMNMALDVDTANTENGMIAITHDASGINYSIPFTDIEQAFCLPVPEKAQRQWNFVVFAKKAFDRKTGNQVSDAEQVVWTMNETTPTNVKFAPGHEPVEQDTYVTSCLRSMNTCLAPLGKGLVIPSDKEFVSAIPQSHRKGEPAYHVKAHRGSKDGYLFFVSCGIIWAFKKPLALFNLDSIESIAYTSVLQRTFNIVISTMPVPETGKTEEVEFSMLDQADFAGIDEYIKKHNLNDASMAAERRAKKLNINGKPKAEDGTNAEAAANGAAEDEETELEKAQRELEDAEDEEEEDYDPGSEGESEGEGSSSDEGEDGGEGEEGAEDDEEEEEAEGLEDEE